MQQDDGFFTGDNPLWDRAMRCLAHPYFALAHSLQWYGADNVPRSGPAIIAPNHQSFYDPVVVTLAAGRRIVYMGDETFFRHPLIGSLMRLHGCVPVGERPYAPGAYGKLLRTLHEGHLCGIFPEGRRTSDGLLNPGKPGVAALALASGAPVIPVTVHGACRAWPIGQALPRPAPIKLLFGRPMVFAASRSARRDPHIRDEATRQIMLRIADGFAELGRPDIASAARCKVLAEPADAQPGSETG